MRIALSLIVLAATCFSGCATPSFKSMKSKLPWSKSEDKVTESDFEHPTRMSVVWTDAVYSHPQHPSTRGFGGRIYFFNQQGQTIPVDGQLVVFGYDDSNGGVPNKVPDRRFVFTPEDFTQHYSETDIGASYSIWLPWDQVGGDKKKISLMPIFTATSGHRVAGEQSVNLLPGKSREPGLDNRVDFQQQTVPPNVPYVRPVNFNAPLAGGPGPSGDAAKAAASQLRASNMRSTTIAVPPHMRQRLKTAPVITSDTTFTPAARAAWDAMQNTQAASPMPAAYGSSSAVQPTTTESREASAQGPLSRRVAPGGRQSSRFALPRSQAPASPDQQSTHARARWQQNPATPQYGQPSERSPGW